RKARHCFRELRLAPVPEGHRKVHALLILEAEEAFGDLLLRVQEQDRPPQKEEEATRVGTRTDSPLPVTTAGEVAPDSAAGAFGTLGACPEPPATQWLLAHPDLTYDDWVLALIHDRLNE